ncbi:MAG: FUN14 domain-containing protein [Planctomycetota bacterium]
MSETSDPAEPSQSAMTPAAAPRPEPRSFGTWLAAMPRWKKIAVGTGLLAALVGGVWSLTTGQPTIGDGAQPTGLSAALIDSQTGSGTGTAGGAAVSEGEPTSRGVFRLGFSFIAGFSIGAFIRATLKIAAIAFGFWLLMTFALAYYELVDVKWDAIDSLWNRFTDNVANEWGDFSRFMLGSLPATALGTTGLAIGLKRH